jgi:hypothetical protein
MATSRSAREHERRVGQIAAEAATEIAADSPLEEEVVVTVEELPPEDDRVSRARQPARALPTGFDPLWAAGNPATVVAAVQAGIAFSQRAWAAQLRYAARMADALTKSPPRSSRST